MSKKNFKTELGVKTGLGSTITGSKTPITVNSKEIKAKVGRPKTQTKEITKSSQEGTKENETRATFIVNEELLDKLAAISYWDRVLIKEVVNRALEEYVEKKNPKPRPEEVRIKAQESTQKLIRVTGNKARLPKY
jgi:hypothetical protein